MMLDFILDIDWKLFYLINTQWTSHWADQFFPWVTDLHKTPFFKMVVVPALLMLFMWLRGIKNGILIFTFCALTILASDGIGNHGFKKTIQRPRPGETAGLVVQAKAPYGGYSFVSNHAANMFGFATFIALVFPASAIPMYFIAGLIGYSRVYNGVHFPTDILGGALIGILCGVIFSSLCKKLIRKINSIEVIGS